MEAGKGSRRISGSRTNEAVLVERGVLQSANEGDVRGADTPFPRVLW